MLLIRAGPAPAPSKEKSEVGFPGQQSSSYLSSSSETVPPDSLSSGIRLGTQDEASFYLPIANILDC